MRRLTDKDDKPYWSEWYPNSSYALTTSKDVGKIKNKKKNKIWNLPNKFTSIAPELRLAYLRSEATSTRSSIRWNKQVAMRRAFDVDKFFLYPLTGKRCYVCNKRANHRHHVIPISVGGKNGRNNIVPLCDPCHSVVHPHMGGGYIGPKAAIQSKPPSGVVVINPS